MSATRKPILPKDVSVDAATRTFFEIIPRELERVIRDLDEIALCRAAQLVLDTESRGGRVHVTGIGKPGHVATYIAALLSSTGTAATVLDASEATHGSAGQLRDGDVLIAISNSGGTPELVAALAAATDMGARIVAVTSSSESLLAKAAEVTLLARVEHEGGPLGLEPRASVLAEILILQALSVELQARRAFTRADYHLRHPGGALGKRTRPTSG